jgi:hypothetical protein
MVVASRTAVSVRSVDEVVNLIEEPKIFKLQKTGGQMNTALIVAVMVSKMADDMHLKDGLTENNIDEIVHRLTTDEDVRYWLTLADISLLCRRIAEGYYGKTYGHFGLAEFNECLIKYCNERTECHRVQNTKTVVDVAAVRENVGYTIDKDGRLVVPEENQGVKNSRPPRYLYDENGNIKGENPKYWASVRRKDEKSTEEMEKINRHNKVMERARQLMKDDPAIGYVKAIEQAATEIESL